MIKFDKPQTLNGEQLLLELNDAKIKITEFPFIDGNGDLWLDVLEKDAAKTQRIIDSHNAIDSNLAKATAKAAAEGKLAALGLTTDDLRALGL